LAFEILTNPLHLQVKVTVLNEPKADFTGSSLVFSPVCMATHGCLTLPPPVTIPLSPSGSFSYNSLTAGTYSVTMPGCKFGSLCEATFPFEFTSSVPGASVTLNLVIGQSAPATGP
jgi:hypothetical protein